MTEYKKIFVDTAPLIYLLEQSPEYYDRIKKLFEDWYVSEARVVTSTITIGEYCVYPYKEDRPDLIEKFEKFLDEYGMEIYNVDRATAKRAAWIRSCYPAFKAMDAIQLAVAGLHGCDCFLTNDKQLRQYSGIAVKVIDELN